MKVKIILAAAALIVIGAQIHYTLSQKDAGTAAAPAAAQTAGSPATEAQADGTVIPAEASAVPVPAPAQIPVPVPVPAPAAVIGIRISVDESEAVRLTAGDSGWVIASTPAAPADSDKIARFLDALLLSSQQPLPLNAGPSVTGLGEDGGVTARLDLAGGGTYAVRVGLRPDGDYHSTFAAFGERQPVVLQADLRGFLGLWRNAAGETPEAAAWLLTRPFSFDPADVVKMTADYPDHSIAFERGPDGGGWKTIGYAPGGEWDNAAVDAWLADLADFTVTGMAGAAGSAPAATPAVKLTLGIADGGSRQMRVFPDPDGAQLRAVLDVHPGLEFALPGWRYGKYFLRAAELFPKSAPRFDVTDIRLIDLRHGGESAKIARRDGEWRLVGLPYTLRHERIEQLARLAAALAPEDYTDPGLKPQRAGGGPVLEIVLAGGTMRQYRLGGRHPMFPWRYVTVDNAGVLSVPATAAAALFPAFGTILDLGTVFAGLDAASLTGVELIRTDDGARLLSLRREDGAWTAGNERGSVALPDAEAEAIASALPAWRVADFFEADAAAGGTAGMMRLRLTGAGGMERGITLLAPQGRDIPYIADGERAFLLRRSDFFGWLGAVRGLARRIDAEADAAAEEVKAAAMKAETEAAQAEETPAPDPAVQPDAPADEEPETNQLEQTGAAQPAAEPTVEPAAEPVASDPAKQPPTAQAATETAQTQEQDAPAEPKRQETQASAPTEDSAPER